MDIAVISTMQLIYSIIDKMKCLYSFNVDLRMLKKMEFSILTVCGAASQGD